jgi:hypothetical protein
MAGTQLKAAAGFFILALCSLLLLTRGYHDLRAQPSKGADFQTVYGMSRCLLHGCDPYDASQVRNAFMQGGGKVTEPGAFRRYEPLYTPPALVLSIPFALLPWNVARVAWLFVTTGSFLLAVFLLASLCSEYSPVLSLTCLGLLVLTSTPLLVLAQPALIAIGCAGIAVWCFLRQKALWLGVGCLVVSVIYKPHVSLLILVYFLLAGAYHRRLAIRVLLLVIAICVPAILWISWMPASAHWMSELPANIAGITARGNVADPGPTNPGSSAMTSLQSLFSVFRDEPIFYNTLAQCIGGALLLVWLYPAIRMRPSLEKNRLAVASIACITLLPIYHLDYDSRLLILIFPAFAVLLSRATHLRVLLFAAMCIAMGLLAHQRRPLLARLTKPLQPLHAWQIALALRPIPIVIVALAVGFLTLFYRRLYQSSREEAV